MCATLQGLLSFLFFRNEIGYTGDYATSVSQKPNDLCIAGLAEQDRHAEAERWAGHVHGSGES